MEPVVALGGVADEAEVATGEDFVVFLENFWGDEFAKVSPKDINIAVAPEIGLGEEVLKDEAEGGPEVTDFVGFFECRGEVEVLLDALDDIGDGRGVERDVGGELRVCRELVSDQ